MSGQWPPEWDDDFHEEADQPGTEAGARLSEVAAYLASVPAPMLPEAVEARISAAIAAEAAARTDGAAPDETVRARTLGPAPARARLRRRWPRPQLLVGPLVICLLVGFGFLVSRGFSSSSSSSSAAASGVAAPNASSPSAGTAFGGAEAGGSATSFVVTASGTSYQRATLAEQVRARLSAKEVAPAAAATAPPSSAASSSAASSSSVAPVPATAPSPVLLGCVLHVADGARPTLVDKGTYEGTPAYIIASSSHVWVVGLGCTAAKPELLASVPLAG